jgi:hypothetical protein
MTFEHILEVSLGESLSNQNSRGKGLCKGPGVGAYLAGTGNRVWLDQNKQESDGGRDHGGKGEKTQGGLWAL